MTALKTGLFAIAALLSSGAAQAVNYTFPGSMPAGCSGSGGSYSCGSLSLGWNDTITIANPKPATITVNGTLYTNNATINAGGAAGDLNLVVTGTLTTAYQAVLNANVTAASVASDSGGTGVKFGGSLAATSGNVVLYETTTVAGSISSTSGSITVGQDGSVAGAVSSTSGAVVVGYRSTVAGAIQTSGAITLVQRSVVSGSVTGTTGPVDVGYAAKVTGPITTSSGAISFEQSSVASGCVTSTGSAPITLKYQASVAGVCCGASCDNLCVTNNSTYAMPAACAPPAPALVLAKTASATDVAVGTSFSYTLTASNSGSAALNDVAVTDVIPTGLTQVTSVATSGAVSVTGQTLTWTIPTLDADSSAQLTLVVLATQQGTFSNTVTAPGALPASAPDVKVGTPPNVYVHYRMDEAAGAWAGTLEEVKDSGSKELHGSRIPTGASGTNVVTPNPTIPSPPVLGSFCNAGNFDGSGAVKTPSNAYFSFTDTLSASVWIYPTAYPSSDLYSILSNDVNYEFHLNTGGRLYWWWQDSGGGAHSLTSSDLIPLNQWTHVAITMDATSTNKRERIYINGQLRASGSWSGALRTNTCPFYIGGDISTDGHCTLVPGRNFHGMIDEVKIYNYELSADDVEADMTLGRQCTGVFDHIQIEHDGVASICASETVTVKACVDAACSTLYTGDVTIGLSPSGWVGGDSFTFSGGVTSRELSHGEAGDVTLGTTGVSPVPAGATRCFKGATESCAMNFAASSCLFDAVEKNANPKTRLFTKLAGVPFNVDVLRLSSSGAINTSYKGTVAVDLVDGSSSACPTGSGLNTATNITYVAGNKGRKTVAFTYDNAARNVRVRAKAGSSLPACSTDSFTIRPQSFDSIASIANADSTGASATATPATKAGSTFSLTAGTGVPGYNGNPKANPALIEWGGVSTGALDGSTPGSPVFSTAASAATGNGASGSFTYNEVGYFRFKANGVYDDTFTVDSGDKAGGDCVVDSFSNALVGGKYGCGFGHASPSNYFGRFIPDHFDTAVTQGCAAGGFTYSGQPFPLTVTARNAAGGVTANYAGGYAHEVTLAARNAGDTADNPGSGVLASNLVLATGFTNGVASATPTYTFGAARTAPTNVRIRAVEPEVSSLRTAPAVTTEGAAVVRSGRARLGSAYGSELLDLPILFRTEFWSDTGGTTGWVVNDADSCTGNAALDAANAVGVTLASTPAALPTCIRDTGNPGLSGANACAAVALAARQFREGGGAAGFAGEFNLWLAAPGANNPGWTTVTATVPAWLGVVPPTRATFGRYKTPLIYRREMY
jgi:uncharacterized repeat protein (TIGR01451 family)